MRDKLGKVVSDFAGILADTDSGRFAANNP